MKELISSFGKLFAPQVRPEVIAAQQSAERVKEASIQFTKHADILGNMVRNIKGLKAKRPNKRVRT